MKKVWIGLVVLVVVGGIGFGIYKTSKKSHGKEKSFPYTVSKGSLNVTILSTGSVSPENRLDIKPPIAGRVENVVVVEGAKVRKGQVLAWMSSTERAALLDAAAAKGPEEVKAWEEMYKSTPVMAPINGTIILRNVESGQTVTATDAIFTMSDRLTVKAKVDETDIAQIKLKQKASIILDAYSNETIPAIVDQIAFDATTTNNVTTYTVDVLPVKTPDFMRSGMTANVTFDIVTKDDALLIPSDSMKITGGKMTVKVPAEDPQDPPLEREIKTGLSDGKRVEVLEGLKENDVILVSKFELQEKKDGGASPFGGPPGRPNGKKK